jgi:predicted nucleic acid-binding protein
MLARNAPHERVLPDANVWLDAAFVPNSAARRAVDTIRAAGRSLIIDECTEREVITVLDRKRLALGLRYDPSGRFNAYLAAQNVIRLPPASPDLEMNDVNRSDRHVARAAVSYSAALLTGDAPLVRECRLANVFAIFPWTIVAQLTGVPHINEILRMAPPSQQGGTIFARTTPGGWRGMKAVGVFTAADVRNVGTLAFDSATLEWKFTSTFGPEVKLAYPMAGEETTVVCMSYKFPQGERQGNIVLRAARFESADRRATSVTAAARPPQPGDIRIGSSFNGNSFWNGYLRHVTVGPDGMSPQKWKAIVELEDGAPNPTNHNILDQALLLI